LPQNKPSHVRLYRDCSSADLAFTAFLTVLAGLAARAPARVACEQPELGALLSILLSYAPGSAVSPDESCERALEHAAVVLLAGLVVLTVVRLHFLLAVGAHYAVLVRQTQALEAGGEGGAGGETQRIRLLPLPRGVAAADVVYAPVHCPAAANSLLGTSAEVWVRAPVVEASRSPSASPYVSPAASPAVPPYASAYVQSQAPEQQPLDAGLLDARVVRTKREWI
jgi:hypothetical protein